MKVRHRVRCEREQRRERKQRRGRVQRDEPSHCVPAVVHERSQREEHLVAASDVPETANETQIDQVALSEISVCVCVVRGTGIVV